MSFFTTPSSPSAKEARNSFSDTEDVQLSKTQTASSSTSESGPPPAYSYVTGQASTSAQGSSAGFVATTQLQIQATGIGNCSSLSMPRPDPIPVYRLQTGTSANYPDAQAPAYLSLRLKRSSNSCGLVRASEPDGTPLIATIYRWGPGRRPRMRILPPTPSISIEDAINADDVNCEMVEVRSRSVFSRAQKIETSFGTFQWRYGSREERREAFDANSLLILEKTDQRTWEKSSKEDKPMRIAQFVRNDDLRTPGTHKYMAGNGGRLMVDLSSWMGEKGATVEKVEAFVVASCICMLKREVDRMRDNNIAAVV
ncbi:hypothetical protein HJFPF1_11045 [Paramyrothecium foliicola]|nr:hypothetical protein HJFPF1_11045 [Paramyrothecium foliicola]